MSQWQFQMFQQQMQQQQMLQQQQYQLWQQQQQQQQMWQQFQQWQQQNPLQQQNPQMQFQQFLQMQNQQGGQQTQQGSQQTQQGGQQTPQVSQQNQGNKIKEMLPRDKPPETMTIGGGPNIINVTMNASTGYKVVINASADTSIEELLKMYTRKIGLAENVIGKDIMFLYNGAQLNTKSKQSIGSFFRNTAVITVYDLNGIIGA